MTYQRNSSSFVNSSNPGAPCGGSPDVPMSCRPMAARDVGRTVRITALGRGSGRIGLAVDVVMGDICLGLEGKNHRFQSNGYRTEVIYNGLLDRGIKMTTASSSLLPTPPALPSNSLSFATCRKLSLSRRQSVSHPSSTDFRKSREA